MSATDGHVSVCGQGSNLDDQCQNADIEIDGAGNLGGDAAIFKVYAAFFTPPRLMGVVWGIQYDDNNITLPYFGMCGDFELNDAGWPGPGTGSTVVWNNLQQSLSIPVYWFAAYTYGQPGILSLIPNPTQGAYFGDDSLPAVLDPIASLGAMGFDMPGVNPCDIGEVTGACCDPATGECTYVPASECPAGHPFFPHMDCYPEPCPLPQGACCDLCSGECSVTMHQDCMGADLEWIQDIPCDPNPCPASLGACCDPATGACTLVTCSGRCPDPGIFHPEWTSCSPNPCPPPPTPAQQRSWGRIKAAYR